MEEKNGGYKNGKVTPSMFSAVKICLESGNNIAETSRFMKLSKAVVTLIRDSETFEDYKTAMWQRAKACHAGTRKKKETPEANTEEVIKEIKSTVQVQASKYMEDRISEAVDLLKTISAKLAVIIDDLYGTKGA